MFTPLPTAGEGPGGEGVDSFQASAWECTVCEAPPHGTPFKIVARVAEPAPLANRTFFYLLLTMSYICQVQIVKK